MNTLSQSNIASIEERIQDWNTRLAEAMPLLQELLPGLKAQQTALQRLCQAHFELCAKSVATRAKLNGTTDPGLEKRQQIVLQHLDKLDQVFARFSAQAKEAADQSAHATTLGAALIEGIAAIQGKSHDAILSLEAEGKELGAGADVSKEIRAENESLREEVAQLKQRLAENDRAQETTGEAMSKASQDELARLRSEIEELRETKQDLVRPVEGDSEARLQRIKSSAQDSLGNKRPMGMILVDAGIITETQLHMALQEQRSAWNRHLGAILVDLGFTSEEAIAQTLAAQMGFPFVKLIEEEISAHAVGLIAGQLATHHSCLPLRIEGDELLIAMANPLDLIALEDLRLATGFRLKIVVAAANDIRNASRNYYAAP